MSNETQKTYTVLFHPPAPVQNSETPKDVVYNVDDLRDAFLQRMKRLAEAGKMDDIVVHIKLDFAQLLIISGPDAKTEELKDFLEKENLGTLSESQKKTDSMDQITYATTWRQKQNERRIELILKQLHTSPLTPDEQTELEQLEKEADTIL